MNPLAHRLSGGIQAQGVRRRPMQAWVSCSGGRTTACDPALCGARYGEQGGPDLQQNTTMLAGGDAWRPGKRVVLEVDPRAKSRAAGLMRHQRQSVFRKECLRLNKVTGIDIQDEVKCVCCICKARCCGTT